MRLLVSGTTKTVAAITENRHRLGVLMTPAGGSVAAAVDTGLPWAIDNGAFSGFNATAFTRLILKAEGQPRLLWVACPDVVGDAAATAVEFYRWSDAIKRLGLPVAYVGQDGCEALGVPWEEFECFFIGGSTEWKLSDAAMAMGREAKSRGKLLHMGRVNSWRRIRRAALMGCDSVDGSSASKFGDVKIAQYLRWIEGEANQKTMELFA